MSYDSESLRAHHRLVDRTRKLTLLGLQATLIGRALEDRQALLGADLAARRAINPQERAFFDIKARYGAAIERLERQIPLTDERRARLASAPPLSASIARRLQTIGADDPGADIETGFGAGEGTPVETEVVAASESELEFNQYAPEIRQAAEGIFDASTNPELLAQQQEMFDQINEYSRVGGKAGGAPHIPGIGFAGGFINDRGDLDIDKVNEVLTGVVVGAAASIGGVVGAALAAFALFIIPRMLTAFEDATADLLVGTLPGQ